MISEDTHIPELWEEMYYDSETDSYIELEPDDTVVHWKNAYGFGDGNYMVSDMGGVMHNGYRLSERKGDRSGHIAFSYRLDGKQYYKYVHRLMMENFNPIDESWRYVVRHLNDCPTDNCLENLAWGTQKDNHQDSVNNKTYRPFTDDDREKSYAKSRKPVKVTNIDTQENIIFRGLNEACRELGIQESNASKVLRKERPHSKRWYFEYLKGECDD